MRHSKAGKEAAAANIIFELYPGMQAADAHVTASAAKVFTSLLIDLLIEEGKIDEQKTMADYVSEFAGTV